MSSRDNRQWNYNPSKALRLTEIKAGRLNYELLNCAPGKNSLCKTSKRTHLNAGSCQNDSRSKNRGTITKKNHFQKLTSLSRAYTTSFKDNKTPLSQISQEVPHISLLMPEHHCSFLLWHVKVDKPLLCSVLCWKDWRMTHCGQWADIKTHTASQKRLAV